MQGGCRSPIQDRVSRAIQCGAAVLQKSGISFTMSIMGPTKQGGHANGMLIGLITTSVLLVASLSFGVWAFMSRQDYKNNSDKKAAAAAAQRQSEVEKAEAAKYAEEAKKPLTSYKAPDQYGGIQVQYPKTWSAYVADGSSGKIPVDDYFHPGAVPDVSKDNNAYALRVQVMEDTYDKVMKSYESDVKSGKLTAAPYSLPNVSGTIGTRLTGQITRSKQGSLVVLPLRNTTIKVWTESANYLDDFNNIILPNLTFVP